MPCSAYPHPHCKGLCIGKEAPGQHDIRLMGALARMRMQAWPFSGAVGIRETTSWGGMTEIHLFDRWVYLGSVKSEQDIPGTFGARPAFELDIYRILAHTLKQAKIDIIPVTPEVGEPEGFFPK